MAKVKGTMMLGLVRAIRADKVQTYNASLTDEDRDVISRRILPSSWYPFAVYKRIFNIVMEAYARNDPGQVRKIGREYGREIVSSVYKNLIIEGDPMESLKKNQIAFKMLFDFGQVQFEARSESCGRLTISEFDPGFEGFYHILAGWHEECLELSGAKGVRSTFLSKSWEGDSSTTIEFSWTG